MLTALPWLRNWSKGSTAQFFLGCIALGSLTLLGSLLDAKHGAAALLYLFAIALTSLWGRLVPSMLVAVIAILCLTYFFPSPFYAYRILGGTTDVVALITFVTAAFVITRLITRTRTAAEALRATQAELAHASRVMTMGELSASIAHEVNQPLAGIVTNAGACLRWLAGDPPDLEEAREAARRIIRDGNRASEVVGRIRALAKKAATAKQRMDLNDAVQEVIALAEGEMRRNGVLLRTELADHLPAVLGDRVQLQQVVLNLVMNGIEAMRTVADRKRVLVIRTQSVAGDAVRVTVQDSGVGLDPQSGEQIFDAFYSTKRGGLGMGLSISRSIVEDHGGRLWTQPSDGPGTTFQFTVPQRP
jgi:C4-dicarboxylate-specific signal transduction histidine kinase